MSAQEWTWANLTSDELALVNEAERTLGATYVLAYRPAPQAPGGSVEPHLQSVRAASLTESQLECLQGLEAQLHTILVAYSGQKSG
jgi:hypothetical protein